MKVKTHKTFPVWRFEQEARYIEKMAHQGKRLEKVHFSTYTFEVVETPMPGTVQLDYQSGDDLPEYEKLLADSGWTILTTLPVMNGAWLYCYHPDSHAKLYSDNQTKISLFERIRNRWTFFGLLIVLLNLPVLTNLSYFHDWFSISLRVLYFALICVYVFNFFALTRQIHRFRN